MWNAIIICFLIFADFVLADEHDHKVCILYWMYNIHYTIYKLCINCITCFYEIFCDLDNTFYRKVKLVN